MRSYRRNFAVPAALILVCFTSSARAQSQQGSQASAAQQSSPSAQSQTAAAAPPASGSTSNTSPAGSQAQAEPQMQVVPGAQQESLADAARRAKAQKAKAAAKVVTDDDVSKISGNGVSVVGDGSSGSGDAGGSGASNGAGANEGSGGSTGGDNGEKYWRGRAREIMNQIAATEQQIAKVKDEIAKSGPTGVDPNSGLSKNVIYIHDRNADVKQLEDRKASLLRQLDNLADEGRKAGADSSWFR